MATDSQRAIEAGASPLVALLERVAMEVPEEILREIASEKRFLEGHWHDYEAEPRCNLSPQWSVVPADSSRVKQLARQELIRRGLEA